VRSYGGWDAVKLFRKEHEIRIGDERILGDTDFVESVLKQDVLNLNKKTSWLLKGWDVEKLSESVCVYLEIAPSDLKNKGRNNTLSAAKSLICYWGINELEISSTEIAIYLGISQPAVSKAKKRGAVYCQEHEVTWHHFAAR